MVSLNEEGQVILVASIIIALILLSLSTVLYTQTTSNRHYFETKYKQDDYTYHGIRKTYQEIIKANKEVDNPFNSTKLETYEDEIKDYCQRRGFMVSFQNKSYTAEEELAKVTLVFSGEGLKYKERLTYDLQ